MRVAKHGCEGEFWVSFGRVCKEANSPEESGLAYARGGVSAVWVSLVSLYTDPRTRARAQPRQIWLRETHQTHQTHPCTLDETAAILEYERDLSRLEAEQLAFGHLLFELLRRFVAVQSVATDTRSAEESSG